MKKFICFIALFLCITAGFSQNMHLDIFLGAANYQGDLQDKRITFSQAHFAGGIGLSYDLSSHFAVRGGIMAGKISADDKKGRNKSRNLNFRSSIVEGNVGLQYYILPLGEYSLVPYVFASIAVYHFNPYTYDTANRKYYLKPLSTEGEGFVSGVKPYNLTQMAIPFGGGVKLNLSDNLNVGVELGFRKLFTDYLDDVSNVYVDKNLLLTNRGAKAVELAYRGGEIKNGVQTYPAQGRQRGRAKYKDWYYFTGLTLSYRLGAGNSNGRMSQLACPRNVL